MAKPAARITDPTNFNYHRLHLTNSDAQRTHGLNTMAEQFTTEAKAAEIKPGAPTVPTIITVNDRAATREAIIRLLHKNNANLWKDPLGEHIKQKAKWSMIGTIQ